MQQRKLNIPPIAVPAAIGNLLNCGVTSLAGPVGLTVTQPYLILRHIRAINTTAAAITLKCFKGATGAQAAGTEWGFNNVSIPAGSYLDWYGEQRFDSADFLTGVGSAAGITLNCEGEIGLS